MILTPHILAGAALGAGINNPLAAAAGAATLHFALDAVPHWDYDIHNSRTAAALKVSADLTVASIATLFLIRHMPLERQISALVGGFFGVLPDGLLFLSYIFKDKHLGQYAKFHNFWHGLIIPKGQQPAFWWGLGVQILIIFLSLFLLLRIA